MRIETYAASAERHGSVEKAALRAGLPDAALRENSSIGKRTLLVQRGDTSLIEVNWALKR